MEKKKRFSILDKCVDWAPSFFLTAIVLCFAFLAIGEIIFPDEKEPMDSYYEEFDVQWYQELPDGEHIAVEVPGRIDAEWGEVVTLVTTIPEDVSKGDYVCFRPIWQDLIIYVDGEPRQIHNTEETRPFGENSAFRYVFVRFTEEDAGKELRYEFTSDSKYAGVTKTVYFGEKSSIWLHLIANAGAKAAAALTLGIMGFFCIVVCFVLRFVLKRNLELRFLAWAIFLCAWWMLSEVEFRQLFIKNISVWTNTTYWSLMLIAFPTLLYVNEVQGGRYKKIYGAAFGYSVIVFVIGTMLQVFDVMQFVTQLPFIHFGLAASILAVIGTLTVDTFNGRLKDYMLVGVGIYGMLLSAVLEMLLYYLQVDLSIGTVLAVGLMFLLVMAIVKTGKDLILSERKKQEAIVARDAQAKFLASMSHEIRTPINAVIGMNEMILRENDDDTIQEYAQNIKRASSMLLELVNDILDFSKIESGQLEIVEQEYYLGNVLHDEKLLLETRIGNKPIDVVMDVDPHIPAKLYGDEVRMKQIMTNLLSNAAKYTERGTITVKVFFQWINDESISLGVQVKDTGVGIKEEDLPTLFDEFRRFDLGKNRNVEGSGLGLNIVKQLVYLMQGNIRVDSEYGKGSTFTVFIPQKVVGKMEIGDFTSEANKVGTDKIEETLFTAPDAKVLVVDDNVMNLTLMKALLKRTQIKVETARSGKECLLFTKQKKYDIIMMDHMMPEMDGVETLYKLRADEGNVNRDTCVIALTANAVAGCREMYMGYGFHDYFSKPIQAAKLEELLVKYLPKETIHMNTDSEKKNEPVAKDASKELLAIDRTLGLSYCMDSEEIYQEMLIEFRKQIEEYLSELDACFKSADWERYASIAHAIKGNALTIGASNFSEVSKKHEFAAKEKNEDFIRTEYPNYADAMKQLAEFVK